MKRKQVSFHIVDINAFKYQVLNWANTRFNTFSFLDNNHYNFESPAFEFKLAIAGENIIRFDTHPVSWQSIREFHEHHHYWLFGHLNYPSSLPDEMGFPAGCFFVPDILITANGNSIFIESFTEEPETIFSEIKNEHCFVHSNTTSPIELSGRIDKRNYVSIIEKLLNHIQLGDCYEINFCQDFFALNSELNPVDTYFNLTNISPNPFSAFYRIGESFCFCASPERFLKKIGKKVISQPIKGTQSRDIENPEKDLQLKDDLLNSQKERSENVMIVDLVRNDLSKIAEMGTVNVSELFGIYSFPQVHQMISTIEAATSENWTTVMDACFPMGSMTGAPKKKVTELIELYETTPRGLFSGSIGYVTPEGNIDFNVVIRSLFYHQTEKFVSCKVGSGITINSIPELEYEECLIKINAIRKMLGG